MDNLKCYIIAEAGLNHNGSINLAKKLINIAASAGVDAVKFQKRTVKKLAIQSTLDAEDNRFPEFGNTYADIRNHLEFDLEEYIQLKNYAESKGLDFMVTAFDIEAFDFLCKVGVTKFKLASHSLTNIELLKHVASKSVSTIISTGMSDLNEIDTAVNIFKSNNSNLAIMHCVSSYPTPYSECNIAMLDVLKNKYNLITGYSGHELGFLPTLVAVSRGAKIVERHITIDKNMIGFDHKISLEPDELNNMVEQIRLINSIIGSGEKFVSDSELVTRKKYHVSMVSNCFIKQNTILTENMIEYKNPGTGIPHKNANLILGKKAVCDINADELLSINMFK